MARKYLGTQEAGLSSLYASASMEKHVNVVISRYGDQYVQEWTAQLHRPLNIKGKARNDVQRSTNFAYRNSKNTI